VSESLREVLRLLIFQHNADISAPAQAPGTSLPYEMRALAESGLTPDEVSRAAGANIIAWLQSQPKAK